MFRCGLAVIILAAWTALGAPQSAPPSDEPVYDIGPGITPPRVTHQVTPQTKPDSRGFRLSGAVVVGLIVSSKGEPKDVHVVTSLDKDVDQTAVEAVEQWTFAPARKGEQPVAVRITVEIRFHSL
ncbi:MAG TPA: energy transducer TonB [Bryobacteraceae bacterium]|nr:energy transducer TonB [Bryobacteraceae bacterium]